MSDAGAVCLEGLHAVKHALRFGAELTDLTTDDPAGLERPVPVERTGAFLPEHARRGDGGRDHPRQRQSPRTNEQLSPAQIHLQ